VGSEGDQLGQVTCEVTCTRGLTAAAAAVRQAGRQCGGVAGVSSDRGGDVRKTVTASRKGTGVGEIDHGALALKI
jgi:hypothetical protein